MYFVIALVIVVFSIKAVTTRKILRSATYLLFVLLAVGIAYFQLGYQFLGAVQIAVYAGGIMVLFVFAILLTHKPNDKSGIIDSHRRAWGITIAGVSGVVLLLAIFYMPVLSGASLVQCIEGGREITMQTIGDAFTGSDRFQYLLPFEAISVLLLACIIGGVTVARKS